MTLAELSLHLHTGSVGIFLSRQLPVLLSTVPRASIVYAYVPGGFSPLTASWQTKMSLSRECRQPAVWYH